MSESPTWRDHVIHGFVKFTEKEISDTKPALLDTTLRLPSQLLGQWRISISPGANGTAAKDNSANVEVLHETPVPAAWPRITLPMWKSCTRHPTNTSCLSV